MEKFNDNHIFSEASATLHANLAIDGIKCQLSHDSRVVLFADESVECFVSAALLIRSIEPDNLNAVIINHGLFVRSTALELYQNLKNLGVRNIHVYDARIEIFDTCGLPSLTSPLSAKRFIKKQLIEAIDKAAESLDLTADNTYYVDFSIQTFLDEKTMARSYNKRQANLKNNDLPNEPFVILNARSKNRVIETNSRLKENEIANIARYFGYEATPFFPSENYFYNISELMHCCRPFKRTDRKIQLELRELFRDYGFSSAIAPITSVELNNGKRKFKHPILVASNNHTLREMSEICRTVPNKLSSVNRILVRIDSDFIAENLQNCGLRTRPKTITVAQEVNRIISDKFKGNNIRSCRGILIPLSESNNKPGSIIIRASAYSNLTYERTAVPGIDFDETVLFEIANEIKEKCPQIGMVFYEITPNMPKTINAI